MKDIPLYDVRKIVDLKDMLNTSAGLYGDSTAFLVKTGAGTEYETVTYTKFKEDVDSLGTALIDLGLKDKRIAVIGENRYEWAVTYLAVVNGTGVVVPIDRMLPENEIMSLLSRAEVNAVVFSNSNRDAILSIAEKSDLIKYCIGMDYMEDSDGILSYRLLVENGRSLMSSGNRDFLDAPIDNEKLSILLYTSATTDESKAVMLSHKNIASNLMDMTSMCYIGPDDIFLSVLPMHHTYECTCGFLCPIYRGSAVAFCEGLRHIAKNLKETGATIMLGVPLIYESMYKKIWEQARKSGQNKKLKAAIKLSRFLKKLNIDITKKLFGKIHESLGGNIRLLISGAAGIDPDVSRGFRDFGIKLLQGYGLTECSPIVTLNRDIDFKDDATGLPLPSIETKIAKPNNEGMGEIIVRGPNVMLGYYKNNEANRKTFLDGWFHTGDMGYIDSDGFLHITGRKKNVIVTKNGKNIYPEEIEALLNKSPYIKECIVFGKEDDDYGDVVVSASIYPDYEYMENEFAENPPGDEEIYNLIRNEIKNSNKKLVTYKYIRDFSIRKTEFEKTTTKKIKRYAQT